MIEELRAEEAKEKETLDDLKNVTKYLAKENDNLKNVTKHLSIENKKLQKGLEDQKESQLQASASITGLEAKLEELEKNNKTNLVLNQVKKDLEEQKTSTGELQKKIEKLENKDI